MMLAFSVGYIDIPRVSVSTRMASLRGGSSDGVAHPGNQPA